jgi:hypothetical protein
MPLYHEWYRGIIQISDSDKAKNQKCHSKMISSCGKDGFYDSYHPDHTDTFYNQNRS